MIRLPHFGRRDTDTDRREGSRSSTPGRVGFTLVELMGATLVIALLALVVVPVVRTVLVRRHVDSVVAEGEVLFRGFQEFYSDNDQYPNATSAPFFDLVTFEPMRSMGFHLENIFERLDGNQADAYDSPDDQGPNQEFWVLMTVRLDPTYRVLVASSDDAPIGSGGWREGVYTFKDGELVAGPGVESGG